MSRPSEDWKHGDIVQNPVTGRLFTAEYDKYTQQMEWLELAPAAAHSQLQPPAGAVLLVRWVDGKPLPVMPLADGELFAVRTVA